MKVKETLREAFGYPIPEAAVVEACEDAGIDPNIEVNGSVRTGANYRRAKALLCQWVAAAPNVTQEGVSYSLSDEQRRALRDKAAALFSAAEEGTADGSQSVVYGYMGDSL